jgi:hypothetical protein
MKRGVADKGMLKSIAYNDGTNDVIKTTFAYSNLASKRGRTQYCSAP